MGNIDSSGSSYEQLLQQQQQQQAAESAQSAQAAQATTATQGVQAPQAQDQMVSARGASGVSAAPAAGRPSLQAPTNDSTSAASWFANPNVVAKVVNTDKAVAAQEQAERQQDVAANKELEATEANAKTQAGLTEQAGMDKAAGDLAQAAASAGSAGGGAAALAKDHKDSVQEESELKKLSQGGPEGPQKEQIAQHDKAIESIQKQITDLGDGHVEVSVTEKKTKTLEYESQIQQHKVDRAKVMTKAKAEIKAEHQRHKAERDTQLQVLQGVSQTGGSLGQAVTGLASSQAEAQNQEVQAVQDINSKSEDQMIKGSDASKSAINDLIQAQNQYIQTQGQAISFRPN